MDWKWLLHALVFLSLIGLQVHKAFERGPRDGVDARWYIGYALSILHERQLHRRHRWGPSFNHTPLRIRAAGKRAGLRLDEVWAIFPPLRLRLRRADGPLADLIGSSFVAVFRKQAGP